jgi:glycosyltransferase involved in cell wall biosynthesis
VHLLTQGDGGPADHVADVAPLLAARGHDVTVVMPDGAAAARVDAAGVRRLATAVRHKTDVGGGAALVRSLRGLRPDVLHCQDRRAGLVGRTLGRGAVRGVVYTLHGVPESLGPLVPGNLAAAPVRRRDRVYYLTLERLLARTGRVVVPSEALARYVREHVGVPAARVDMVRNGVDTARFAPDPAHSPGEPLRVVWLGLMVPVKRLDVLLAAVRDVPDMTLLLAGDGPLRGEVEQAARALGGRVELPGFVRDPAPLLAGADAFVLPSAAENCPLALLQAMASGLPVVASRVGGIPEVVTDGETGLLVSPGDPVPLAAALRSLHDPALRTSLGKAARAHAESALDLDTCVTGLERVYERVLA